MIKVYDPETKMRPGLEVIESLIKKRVDDALIEPDALRLLIDKTGGVLRHVFEVLNIVSTMTDVSVPISETAIRYGLNQLRKTCWQQIAEPVDNTGGVISVNELYDRLTEYAKAQLQGKKTIPQSDPINRLLLSICALIEYNGEGWFGVHPLVVENLEKLGRLNLCEP
jgi:hypothetical protein